MKNPPAETLIKNLKMLMTKTGMSSADIAKKSGVSKRMIDYILSGERKPSVEVAGQIAEGFGLTGWQLIMPSLPYDIAKDGTLDKLINNFSHCDNKSQDYISHIAEKDAVYKLNGQ
jgi:transcriptional regulator with XRE-family HTH domain